MTSVEIENIAVPNRRSGAFLLNLSRLYFFRHYFLRSKQAVSVCKLTNFNVLLHLCFLHLASYIADIIANDFASVKK